MDDNTTPQPVSEEEILRLIDEIDLMIDPKEGITGYALDCKMNALRAALLCSRLSQNEEECRMYHALLSKAIGREKSFPCPQGCSGGAFQVEEDEWQQCQYCAEIQEMEQALSPSQQSND